MAVIINEFEVVPAPEAAPAAGGAQAAQTGSGPTAHDVELFLARLARRQARLRAH